MKYIKILSLSILFMIFILGLYIYISVGDMCKNVIYKEYISPNKEKKAIIFRRDCGATTAYSTHISVIDINKTLKNESGNIYIIKGIPKEVAPRIDWFNNQLNIHTRLTGMESKAEVNYGLFYKINIKYD